MLVQKIKGFIAYCKVAGFKDKSIETLSLRLNEFNKFLKSKRLKNIQSVTYSHQRGRSCRTCKNIKC